MEPKNFPAVVIEINKKNMLLQISVDGRTKYLTVDINQVSFEVELLMSVVVVVIKDEKGSQFSKIVVKKSEPVELFGKDLDLLKTL